MPEVLGLSGSKNPQIKKMLAKTVSAVLSNEISSYYFGEIVEAYGVHFVLMVGGLDE